MAEEFDSDSDDVMCTLAEEVDPSPSVANVHRNIFPPHGPENIVNQTNKNEGGEGPSNNEIRPRINFLERYENDNGSHVNMDQELTENQNAPSTSQAHVAEPTTPLSAHAQIQMIPAVQVNGIEASEEEEDDDCVPGPSRNQIRPRNFFGRDEDDAQIHMIPTFEVNGIEASAEEEDDDCVPGPSRNKIRPPLFCGGDEYGNDKAVDVNIKDQLMEDMPSAPSTSAYAIRRSPGERKSTTDSESGGEASEDESDLPIDTTDNNTSSSFTSQSTSGDNGVDIDHHLESLKYDSRRKQKRPGLKSRPQPRTKRIRKHKPRSRSGSESSANAKTKEEDHEAESQKVSIHKISMHKFANLTGATEAEIIEKIVENYNGLNKDHDFVKDNVSSIPKILKEDAKYFKGHEFEVMIYTQTVINRSRLFTSFGITKQSIQIHGVIFYYRAGEIFALTTAQAYNVVQSCSDYDFPIKVAARLLSEKGQKELTSKHLVGNEASTKKTMKEHQQTNPFALPSIHLNLTAELRDQCSLHALSAFRDSKKNKTLVTVSLASIRIMKRLSSRIFGSILSHFSVIARGELTYKYTYPVLTGDLDVNCTEQDTEAHLQSLSRVSTELTNTLDADLCELISSAAQSSANNSDAMRKLDSFNLCHKYVTPFLSANEWSLMYKKERSTWYTVPTMRDIVNAIPIGIMKENVNKRLEKRERKSTVRMVPEQRELDRKKELLLELDKCKISFQTGSAKPQADKLRDFIEGPWLSDGRTYWRVMTQWCSLRGTYLLTVHKQYIRIVSDGLLKSEDEGFLSQPMPFINRENGVEKTLDNYIRKYENTPNYFVWKGTGEELFDLLYVGNKKAMYLYYFVPGLSYKALVKGGRICTAFLAYQKECLSRKKSDLTEFYNTNDRGLKTLFTDIIAFKQAMAKAKIVYAVGRDEDVEVEAPSLVAESELKTVITVQNIRDVLLDHGKDPALAESIHKALVEEQYLETTDSITSKVLIAVQHNFRLTLELDDLVDFVFTKIIQKHQSGFNNILLKLDLWRIEKELSLSEKGSKFLICEIPRPPIAGPSS